MHDREPAGHRLDGHVAEGFGDRRIEQHVHAGNGSPKVGALLKAGEDRIGKPVLEPFARGAVAYYQHLVPDLTLRELIDGVGKDVQPLFHHQPPNEADGGFVVGNPQ